MRIPLLARIPAAVRFFNVEPLIAPVSLLDSLEGIGWVIAGGESGNKTGKYRYRPCELNWIASVVRECGQARVPVFVKQLGTHLASRLGLRNPSGANATEWPGPLQRQQFSAGFGWTEAA